jgi:hypothetical protein
MATECRQDSLDFGTAEGRAVVGAFDGGVIRPRLIACTQHTPIVRTCMGQPLA